MIPAIQIEHVVKRYGELPAPADGNLDIGQGEFFGLRGPHGWLIKTGYKLRQ